MAHYSFSALNERLRPRLTASDRLYSSLYRMEYGYSGSLKPLPTPYRKSILPSTLEPEVSDVLEAGLEEPREDAEREVSAEPACTEPSQLTETQDKISQETEEEEEEDSRVSPSEDKDIPGELASKVPGDSTQPTSAPADVPHERSYVDGTLPDLIRSGRPLGRRRTLGHVSETVGRFFSGFSPAVSADAHQNC